MSFNVHFQFSQNQLEYIDNNTMILEDFADNKDVKHICKVFVNGQSTSIISINNEYKRGIE